MTGPKENYCPTCHQRVVVTADQQQAAEVKAVLWKGTVHGTEDRVHAYIAEREAAARADEAARWQTKIEALATAYEKRANGWRALLARDATGFIVARALRGLMDGER